MEPVKIFELDETTRVVVEIDEYAEKPDWGNEGDYPVFTIEYLGWYRCVPQNAAAEEYENKINAALSQWGRDYDMLNRYFRAFFGASNLYWDSYDRGDELFIFDPLEAVETRFMGEIPPLDERSEALNGDLGTWIAWARGDVYIISLERLRKGHTTWDDGTEYDVTDWESVESVGGYYGDDEITDEALTDWAREISSYV